MRQDFMGYLYEQFEKTWDPPAASENQSAPVPVAAEFLGFARKFLLENPPVTVDYVNRGLGVTLRNGQYCTFLQLPDQPEDKFQMYGGEIAVTDQNRDVNTTNMLGWKI